MPLLKPILDYHVIYMVHLRYIEWPNNWSKYFILCIGYIEFSLDSLIINNHFFRILSLSLRKGLLKKQVKIFKELQIELFIR